MKWCLVCFIAVVIFLLYLFMSPAKCVFEPKPILGKKCKAIEISGTKGQVFILWCCEK